MRTRFTAICVLTALAATVLAAQPTVTSLSPARNTNDAATTTNFDAGFSANMATPGSNDIRAWSNLRGKLAGAISGGGTAMKSSSIRATGFMRSGGTSQSSVSPTTTPPTCLRPNGTLTRMPGRTSIPSGTK